MVFEQIFQNRNFSACILCEELKICLGPHHLHELGTQGRTGETRESIFCFPSEISMLWQTAQTVSYLVQFNIIGYKPENIFWLFLPLLDVCTIPSQWKLILNKHVGALKYSAVTNQHHLLLRTCDTGKNEWYWL